MLSDRLERATQIARKGKLMLLPLAVVSPFQKHDLIKTVGE
jgi:hypothetical protein